MVNVVDGVLWKTKNWLGDGTSKNTSGVKNVAKTKKWSGNAWPAVTKARELCARMKMHANRKSHLL
jgi:hypothetical protein